MMNEEVDERVIKGECDSNDINDTNNDNENDTININKKTNLNHNTAVQHILKGMGIARLHPFQEHAFAVLQAANSALIDAPCGSGKTLAYLLPVVVLGLTAVIIVPTRELVAQIEGVLHQIETILPQHKRIEQTGSVRVCTAGAFPAVDGNADVLVVDEADKTLSQCVRPKGVYRQVVQVSATLCMDGISLWMDRFVRDVWGCERWSVIDYNCSDTMNDTFNTIKNTNTLNNTIINDMNNTINTINNTNNTNNNNNRIIQFIKIKHDTRPHTRRYRIVTTSAHFLPNLVLLLKSADGLVFFNTINSVRYHHQLLKKLHVNVRQIHSKMKRKLKGNGTLLSTDLVARGIDFRDVRLVVDYEPGLRVHREGRINRHCKGKYVIFIRDDECTKCDCKSECIDYSTNHGNDNSKCTKCNSNNNNNSKCNNNTINTKQLFFNGKSFTTKHTLNTNTNKLNRINKRIYKLLRNDHILYRMAVDAYKSYIKYNEGNNNSIEYKSAHLLFGLENEPFIDLVKRKK